MPDREPIHSGHFMSSKVHQSRQEEEEEVDVVSEGVDLPDPEVTPDTKDDRPVMYYNFGPQTTLSFAIDTSLSKLDKCIQIAYEHGHLITPKWKNFKGMKLFWKDRIRLNNVIWRQWYNQFVRRTPPKYCFFSIPEDDWHNCSEAAGVMEGMYWKRRLETVCAQYKRWRHFYYKRSSKAVGGRMRSGSLRNSNSEEDAMLLPLSMTPLSVFDDDDWSSWFTDSFVSSLSQPYLFPNPKEMAQVSNADLIQPGLLQLQPSLEEIMASLESSDPLIVENDPALNGNDQDCMERMVGHGGSDEHTLEHLRQSASHYTSRDYAAASLLVEYSNSVGTVTSRCSSVLQRQTSYDSNTFDQFSCLRSGSANALCEPYLPQLATIDTMGSQQVQYTLAKTWTNVDNNSSSATVMATTNGRKPYGVTPTEHTIRLLRSEPRIPRPTADMSNGCNDRKNSLSGQMLDTKPPVQKRSARGRGKGRGRGRDRTVVDSEPLEAPTPPTMPCWSMASTAPTVVSIIGAGSASRQSANDSLAQIKRRSSAPEVKPQNASANASNAVQPQSTTNLTDWRPMPEQDFDSVQDHSASQMSQVGIVRPVPISLPRAESAFSALSPPGFSPPGLLLQSPVQRSVCGVNDLTKVPSVSTTLVTVEGSSQTVNGNAESTSSPARGPPVFILQSFSGMQLPIMALPYTSTSALPTSSTKQEVPDQVFLSSYRSGAASTLPERNKKSIVPSQSEQQQQSTKYQLSIESPMPTASDTRRNAKRPADSTLDPFERKRVQHLHAEQSRRTALKSGFELLEDLLPELGSGNTKPTNTTVLVKSADKIRELKSTCSSNEVTLAQLKAEIQQLNDTINSYQNRLTTAGPSSSSKVGAFQHTWDTYVKKKIEKSWRFWLLAKIFEPLLESFKAEVQGTTKEQLFSSALQWAKKHCNHAELRPIISQYLVQLAIETPLLRDPSSFPQYVQEQALK